MTKSKYTRLQLAEQAQRVGATFLGLLCDDVERLYALELHMMKEDIEHGWRCFYGQEVGLEKHLPPPLVNESGKVWNLAALRQILIEGNTYPLWSKQVPQGYRNYLDIGILDIFSDRIHRGESARSGSERRYHPAIPGRAPSHAVRGHARPRTLIEVQLRFRMPRIRQQIAFPAPYVDAALAMNDEQSG